MPNIQFWASDDFPLSGKEVKRLIQATTEVFTAAVNGNVNSYFVGNTDVREILDKLRLAELKKE